MLFNSYIFILLFLPVTLIGYFFLGHKNAPRAASVFLLFMSLSFYAYFNIKYLPLIFISIAANYIIYRVFEKDFSGAKRKLVLAAGILFNISLLFYYKYLGFFFENINALFSTDLPVIRLLLPLGISFFTFQQLSFVIDAYKREVPRYGILDYALFVSYFPQLIAGPIVTHDELVLQLADPKKKKVNWQNMSEGLLLFSVGLAKKVLFADMFGVAANYGFSNIAKLSVTDAVIVMLSYTLQLYFDFSGYCDMASGIGRMMNIDLPENFISPYKADSVGAFWRGWHITLTRFFTKYIYYPLGGSKKGVARTCLNIMTVFAVSGIWHGAEWTFVLWGVAHGLIMVFERIAKKPLSYIPKPLKICITFALVNLLWVLFRAENTHDALQFYSRLADLDNFRISSGVLECFETAFASFVLTDLTGLLSRTGMRMLCMAGIFALSLFIVFFLPTARDIARGFKRDKKHLAFVCVLLFWCICSLSGVSTFLYFNF